MSVGNQPTHIKPAAGSHATLCGRPIAWLKYVTVGMGGLEEGQHMCKTCKKTLHQWLKRAKFYSEEDTGKKDSS